MTKEAALIVLVNLEKEPRKDPTLTEITFLLAMISFITFCVIMAVLAYEGPPDRHYSCYEMDTLQEELIRMDERWLIQKEDFEELKQFMADRLTR